MNHDHAVPQQILSILNPQFIVEESNGTVVLGRKVGKRTISVRGCQPGRMCVLVVVQGGKDVRLYRATAFSGMMSPTFVTAWKCCLTDIKIGGIDDE